VNSESVQANPNTPTTITMISSSINGKSSMEPTMPQPEQHGNTHSQTYVITVHTPAAQVESILLNGSTGPVTVELEEANAGALIAHVTVTTKNDKPYTDPLTLGGIDGAWFTLSNGGVAPCELTVGAGDITADEYQITLTAA
jgi:hypothetical protein